MSAGALHVDHHGEGGRGVERKGDVVGALERAVPAGPGHGVVHRLRRPGRPPQRDRAISPHSAEPAGEFE